MSEITPNMLSCTTRETGGVPTQAHETYWILIAHYFSRWLMKDWLYFHYSSPNPHSFILCLNISLFHSAFSQSKHLFRCSDASCKVTPLQIKIGNRREVPSDLSTSPPSLPFPSCLTYSLPPLPPFLLPYSLPPLPLLLTYSRYPLPSSLSSLSYLPILSLPFLLPPSTSSYPTLYSPPLGKSPPTQNINS